MAGAAASAAVSLLPASASFGFEAADAPARTSGRSGRISTADGAELYFNDWGVGPPIVFSHGWPLSADAFEDQMLFFASRGRRCVAHDRRGHGRSSQPWQGNDMDTYADDLFELLTQLDLKDVVLVGHSSGGGEVARYMGRHRGDRIAKVVLISAIPPIMVKSIDNPGGSPLSGFDSTRASVLADRSQFFRDLSSPFYGYNRPGAAPSDGVRESFWRQGMMAGLPAAYFSIKAFSETDFTQDLRTFAVPTLVLHGSDDQLVPIADSALLSAKIVRQSKLVVVAGAPHGLCTTHKDRINTELAAFVDTEG